MCIRERTFFLVCFGLVSALLLASEKPSSESSVPSMNAFPLTVMGPLPCSYASLIDPDIKISPPAGPYKCYVSDVPFFYSIIVLSRLLKQQLLVLLPSKDGLKQHAQWQHFP